MRQSLLFLAVVVGMSVFAADQVAITRQGVASLYKGADTDASEGNFYYLPTLTRAYMSSAALKGISAGVGAGTFKINIKNVTTNTTVTSGAIDCSTTNTTDNVTVTGTLGWSAGDDVVVFISDESSCTTTNSEFFLYIYYR